MSDVPDKSTFASLYSGQAPWDIGRPQKAFLDAADQITGSILDAGCGTGDIPPIPANSHGTEKWTTKS
jgi:hypothetical protein